MIPRLSSLLLVSIVGSPRLDSHSLFTVLSEQSGEEGLATTS